MATLNCALEQNQGLKSVNLESNKISPLSIADLFEALVVNDSNIVELHLTGQEQSAMGWVNSSIFDDFA